MRQKSIKIKNIQKRTNKAEKMLLFFLIVIMLLPFKGAMIKAQSATGSSSTANSNASSSAVLGTGHNETSGEVQGEVHSGVASSVPTANPELESKKIKTASFFNQIKAEIDFNQQQVLAINKNVKDATDKLDATHIQINTLSSQLKNLNDQIANTQSIIENVNDQIQRKETEIQKLYYQIEIEKTEISFQKEMLIEYLQMLYKENNSISNSNDLEQKINSIKLLLGNDTAGETLKELRYSEILEETGRDIFQKLADLLEEQKNNQQLLEVKKRNLSLLSKKLTEQKDQLQVQQKAKAALLEQTKGQEAIYQELLDESKKQQEQVLGDIESLRKNMAFIQSKMRALGDKFNPDDYANLLTDSKTKAIYDYLNNAKSDNADFSPNWPVSPLRGISAYFHDKDYIKVIGMEHNAIDLPTPQGTPIKAPANGIVFKAKDNGYGYSYIILAHDNGFMTVFGHVSDIKVAVGEIIKAGDIIGLSGATPGTKGAGLYTTGAHLHFEVLKGGKYQDPLNYLNLAYLPLETLPEKYLARAVGDREKVKRVKDQENTLDAASLTDQVEINGAQEGAVANTNTSK